MPTRIVRHGAHAARSGVSDQPAVAGPWRRRDGRVGLYAGFCPRAPHGLPMGGHPSRPAVAGRLERSTRRLGRAALERLRSPAFRWEPLDLAPGGVYRATPVTRGAGGLLHHRFTLTWSPKRQAVYFLWHFPAGRPGLPLTTTLPCGVRTFLGNAPKGIDATARPTRPPCRQSYG